MSGSMKSARPTDCAIRPISYVGAGFPSRLEFHPMSTKVKPLSSFSASFLSEVEEITRRLDTETIEKAVAVLAAVRDRAGRLFVIGVGGSAANASHAVNDFRKIVGIE